MSEYEGLRSEIMTVMDSLNEYGRTVNRYMAVVNDQVTALWADNAELRDEINAVANRLENLTRAVTTDPAEVAAAIVNDANRQTLREVRGEGRERAIDVGTHR
jgi:uncharacterized protein YfcZ (UPF0381/DUF406 family)